MVKYLKNECTYQEIQDIDDKLEAQTKLKEDTYMPNVDDHGIIYLNEKRVGKVDVCINVTIITTDIDFRDLKNYVKRAIVTMSTKGIDVENYDIQHIDDVTTDYVIIDSIKEKNFHNIKGKHYANT